MPKNSYLLIPLSILFGGLFSSCYMAVEIFATSVDWKMSFAATALNMLVPDPAILLVRGLFGGILGLIVGASMATSLSGKGLESGVIATIGGLILSVIIFGWALLFLLPYAGTNMSKRALLSLVYVEGPVALVVLYGVLRFLMSIISSPTTAPATSAAEPISDAGQ